MKSYSAKYYSAYWDSLEAQWLGLCTAGGIGSIPGQGTKILRATPHSQKQTKKRKSCHV